ncbi:hypothetical protein K488DRAFT_7714, partial [Vararia minispora EC-137]
MGKLNIAHHKSYHPYRADNIARVRKDEEEARRKQTLDNDRALVADAEARMEILRQRAGLATETNREEPLPGPSSALPPSSPSPSTGRHINLFEDIEEHAAALAARASKKSAAIPESDRGVALAPSKKDLSPWYTSSQKGEYEPDGKRNGWRMRDHARKSHADPLASIPVHLRNPSARPPAAASRQPHALSSLPSPQQLTGTSSSLESRLTREASERERAQALIRRKQAERAASATPSTVHGGGYTDVYNRAEVEEAHRGWGRKSWDRDRDLRN